MRTFATFLTTLALLNPSLALAQTPPPPAIPGTHPDAVPPTKAPTKALAPTPLPTGQMTVSSSTTTSTGKPTSVSTEESPTIPSSSDSASLYLLVGLGVVLVAGVGLFLKRRGKGAQTEI